MKRKAATTSGQSAAKRQCAVEKSKPATPEFSTTLLDLNDDCLFAICSHLDLVDLASVADVCNRLKPTTQDYFELSKYRQMSFPRDISTMNKRPPFKKRLQQMCRVMRNFGSMVESLLERDHADFDFFKRVTKANRSKYRRLLFKLLVQYCGANLKELYLTHFDPKDVDIGNMPQLSLVNSVTLNACETSNELWGQLARWCPKMMRLQLISQCIEGEKVKPYDVSGLHQRFPALQSVEFCQEDAVQNQDIVDMLKRNPKLTQLHLNNCPNVDIRLIAAIEEYLPKLTQIRLKSGNLVAQEHFATLPDNFEKMHGLKRLELALPEIYTDSVLAALRKLATVNRSLEELSLFGINLTQKGKQFVELISGQKNLQSLKLRKMRGLDASHFLSILQQHPALGDIEIRPYFPMTAEFVERLICHGENLKRLHINGYNVDEHFGIDRNCFQNLADIVGRRRVKMQLTIELTNGRKKFPDELAKMYENLLNIVFLNKH